MRTSNKGQSYVTERTNIEIKYVFYAKQYYIVTKTLALLVFLGVNDEGKKVQSTQTPG